MGNENTMVSVIMPCYNKAKWVKEAIESVLKQTYADIEIVVVNDGSSDNSSEVIKSITDKNENIMFFDEKENRGVVWARNFAISKAKGEFILPLDADDTIDETYVEKAVKILEQNPKMLVGCRHVFDKDLKDEKGLIDSQKILIGDEIFVCSTMFRKADFEAIGGYKDIFDKIGCEDWELFINFIDNGFRFYKINEKLFNYRRNTDGCRTETQLFNQIEIKKNLIMLHPNLYLTEDNIKTMFYSKASIGKLERKRKKYRKLFNIMLIVSIVEFLLFVFAIIMKGQLW